VGVYVASSAATGFALEGSVERTLAGAALACVGLAGAAYGGTIRRVLLLGREEEEWAEAGEEEATEAFAGFQRRYLGVQLLATFVDFVQGPYLYKVYAGTYALGVVSWALALACL
jgi:hypothetical protein